MHQRNHARQYIVTPNQNKILFCNCLRANLRWHSLIYLVRIKPSRQFLIIPNQNKTYLPSSGYFCNIAYFLQVSARCPHNQLVTPYERSGAAQCDFGFGPGDYLDNDHCDSFSDDCTECQQLVAATMHNPGCPKMPLPPLPPPNCVSFQAQWCKSRILFWTFRFEKEQNWKKKSKSWR